MGECGCDYHGYCGPYNSSHFSESELEYHKQWSALFNRELETFNNISVCYCDTDWTGYGDLGNFQHEVLQNCANSKYVTVALWAISVLCYTIILLSMAVRCVLIVRSGKFTLKSFTVMAQRTSATLTFLIAGYLKIVYVNEPWVATIGVSPFVTTLYLVGVAGFLYDITETQKRQAIRYYQNVFKDFGFADRVRLEGVHIQYGARVQQIGTLCGSIVFAAATIWQSHVLHSTALIVLYSLLVLTLLVDVFIIDPMTHSRFLNILKKMMKAGDASEANYSTRASVVVINTAHIEANNRMKQVYRQVALKDRAKKVQALMFVVSCLPLYNKHWWKYMGYNLSFACGMFSAMSSVIHVSALHNLIRRARKPNKKTGTKSKFRHNPKVASTEVSAFKSTEVSVHGTSTHQVNKCRSTNDRTSETSRAKGSKVVHEAK